MELRLCFGFCSIIGSITLFLILWTAEISALKQGHQISILLANAICNYTKIPQAVKLVLSPEFDRGIRVHSKKWEGDSWGYLHKHSSSRFNLIAENPEEKSRRVKRAIMKRQANDTKSKMICYQGECDNSWDAESDYPECGIAYYKNNPTGFYAAGYFEGFCYPNAEYCDFCYSSKCNDPAKYRCHGPHPPPALNFYCYMGNCDNYVKVHSNFPECVTVYFPGGGVAFYPQNKRPGYCREAVEKCVACDKNECNDPAKNPACTGHPPPPPTTVKPPPPPPDKTTPAPPPARRPCQKKALELGFKSQVDFEIVHIKTHNSSLYALVIRPELPWAQAMYACATHGMILTDARNTAELNFLNGFLYDHVDTSKPLGIWTGGHRFRGGIEKREAKWFEGDQLIDKNVWNDGEGSDLDHKENCVMLENKESLQFKASDTTCEKCLPFICKSLI